MEKMVFEQGAVVEELRDHVLPRGEPACTREVAQDNAGVGERERDGVVYRVVAAPGTGGVDDERRLPPPAMSAFERLSRRP